MAVRTHDDSVNQAAKAQIQVASEEFYSQVYNPLSTAYNEYKSSNQFDDASKVDQAGEKMMVDLNAMKQFFDAFATNLGTSSTTIQHTQSGAITTGGR